MRQHVPICLKFLTAPLTNGLKVLRLKLFRFIVFYCKVYVVLQIMGLCMCLCLCAREKHRQFACSISHDAQHVCGAEIASSHLLPPPVHPRTEHYEGKKQLDPPCFTTTEVQPQQSNLLSWTQRFEASTPLSKPKWCKLLIETFCFQWRSSIMIIMMLTGVDSKPT